MAGLFALLSQIVVVYLDYQPYPQPASVPDGFTTGWVRYIDFVGSHASAYNAEFVLLGLAALALLPGAIALLVSLRKVDIGFSVIGTAFLVVGVVFAVIESVDFFTVTQAASAWDSGCTACGIYPLQESFGASTSSSAQQVAGLLLLAGILVLSVTMLRGTVFSRFSGVFGVVTVLYGLVVSFATSGGTDSDIATAVTYVLLTLWAVSLAPRLLGLARAEAGTPV